MSTTLIARMKDHDTAQIEFYLDYVTLKSGFTYRHLDVSRYDEDGIIAHYKRPSGEHTEVYLKADEIASAQIVTIND